MSGANDVLMQTTSVDLSWDRVLRFLQSDWRPFATMLGTMSRSMDPADFERFATGQRVRLDALLRRGQRMGLPMPAGFQPSRTVASGSIALGRHAADHELAALGAMCCGDLGADDSPDALHVELAISPDRMLHALLCVNGQCYRGQANIGPLLDQLGAYARDYHQALHAPGPVSAVGSVLVGALADEHTLTISAGWWSKLKKTVNKTIGKLKGSIATAAGIAAGAAVAAVPGVGPAIAPIAGNLAHSLVNAAAGTGSVKAAAQAAVAEAQQIAKVDPKVKLALDHAHKAVAQTTAAYHIAETVDQAANGDADAQKKIAAMADAAVEGDVSAQKAMQIAKKATSALAADTGAPVAAAGWNVFGAPTIDDALTAGDVVGRSAGMGIDPFVQQSRAHAMDAVQRRLARGKHGVVGYVHMMTGERYFVPFRDSDHADDWFGRLEPGSYVYAAYYDPADPSWPHPLNEAMFQPTRQAVGHWLLPMGVGAGAALAAERAWAWYRTKRGGDAVRDLWRAHASSTAPAAAAAPVEANPEQPPITASGMPAWLPFALAAGGGAGLVGWYAYRGRHPVTTPVPTHAAGDIAPNDPIFVDIPVVDEDGNPNGEAVSWPTSQSHRHGGRPPDMYLAPELDSHGGNVFLWMPKNWRLGEGNAVHSFTPTWKVNRHRARMPVASAGIPWVPIGVAAGLGAGAIAFDRYLDRHAKKAG